MDVVLPRHHSPWPPGRTTSRRWSLRPGRAPGRADVLMPSRCVGGLDRDGVRQQPARAERLG
ncbi:hypothetical protein ACSNOI_38010 [Actinomadura kijaniata]|uniref:hypothetical protein n=1 Tax=Actinomadura kijaniata TaxID=46161 RepID=UPI003F1E18B0